MMNRLGEQIGNYRLIRKIGQGGFAEVYLGEHIYLRTQAAIKILQMRLAEHDMLNFLTEARTIAHLTHPNIVRVMDFGVELGIPFLVMDYAPNGTLRQRSPNGSRLPLTEIVSYVNQVSSALQYAHDQKLIHRDIKPENMLVGRNNEILLSDFGIALAAQSSLYQSTQDVVGTVGYMAPEQIQGRPRPASDQYSLGIVVYEWLSGNRPFHGSFTELCTQHMFASPPPLREKVPTLPPPVEQVVQRALAKDPHQRFATIQDFASAFEQACQLQQPIRAPSMPGSQISSPQYGQFPQQLSQSAIVSSFPSTPPANATPFPQQQTSDPSSQLNRRGRLIVPTADVSAPSRQSPARMESQQTSAAIFPPFPTQQPISGLPFPPQQPGRPLPSSPLPSNITPPLPQQPARSSPYPPQQSMGGMPYASPHPSATFPAYPQQQPMGSASYIQQQPPMMAPLQYPGATPPMGSGSSVYNSDPAYGPPPASSPSRWGGLTAPRPTVVVNKPRVWSIRVPQIIAMIIGAILFGALSHIIGYWHFDTSGSTFLNDGFVLPAIIISLFFGALFGPWVGAVTGGLGAFIGDYMFMFYLDHFTNSSILNNGIWHGSPLANVSLWIGFTLRTNTDWLWILSNASIGFITGLAMMGTRGRYVTVGRIALAELLSAVGILASLGLLLVSNAWHLTIPYYNLIQYPTADALNIGFTHIILPNLALALTTVSLLLPLTNAFTRSRE